MKLKLSTSVLRGWFMILAFSLLGFSLFSQENESSAKVKSSEWQKLKKEGDVLFSYRYDECLLKQDGMHKEEAYIQIKNLSSKTIALSWELELDYGYKCFNCSGDENDELKFAITLQPNESIEGFCGDSNQYKLKILSKFLGGESDSKLSDFNVKNIKVSYM